MDNSPGEWVMAYHGTVSVSKVGIIQSNLNSQSDPYKQESYQNPTAQQYPGPGIYCSPDISILEKHGFCKDIEVPVKGGKAKYKVAFMCRIHPDYYTEHNPSNDATHAPNGTKVYLRAFDPQFIRPYGLLIKRV